MGPGEHSEIFIGSISVTKLKYESELSQWNPGCKSVCGVEHCCLFTLFWMGYKSKAFLSEACRAAHEDLIR